MKPALPAPHYGRVTSFERDARRAFRLSPLDARALLVIVLRNGTTCAALGDELWGRSGRGNCSCPWARPAGVVIKRLRQAGLVEIDKSARDRVLYRPTTKVSRAAPLAAKITRSR